MLLWTPIALLLVYLLWDFMIYLLPLIVLFALAWYSGKRQQERQLKAARDELWHAYYEQWGWDADPSGMRQDDPRHPNHIPPTKAR